MTTGPARCRSSSADARTTGTAPMRTASHVRWQSTPLPGGDATNFARPNPARYSSRDRPPATTTSVLKFARRRFHSRRLALVASLQATKSSRSRSSHGRIGAERRSIQRVTLPPGHCMFSMPIGMGCRRPPGRSRFWANHRKTSGSAGVSPGSDASELWLTRMNGAVMSGRIRARKSANRHDLTKTTSQGRTSAPVHTSLASVSSKIKSDASRNTSPDTNGNDQPRGASPGRV